MQNAITIAEKWVDDIEEANISVLQSVLMPLIQRAELREGSLSIQLNMKILYEKLGLKIVQKNSFYEIIVPYKMTRCGRQMKVIMGEVKNRQEPDIKLMRVMNRAADWGQRLLEGETVVEMAALAKKDHSTIMRALRLNFLAPDIIEAIFEGTQPISLTANKLLKVKNIPHDWPNQRKYLGFPKAQ